MYITPNSWNSISAHFSMQDNTVDCGINILVISGLVVEAKWQLITCDQESKLRIVTDIRWPSKEGNKRMGPSNKKKYDIHILSFIYYEQTTWKIMSNKTVRPAVPLLLAGRIINFDLNMKEASQPCGEKTSDWYLLNDHLFLQILHRVVYFFEVRSGQSEPGWSSERR